MDGSRRRRGTADFVVGRDTSGDTTSLAEKRLRRDLSALEIFEEAVDGLHTCALGFVCDIPAKDCASWSRHCDAEDRGPMAAHWKTLRRAAIRARDGPAAPAAPISSLFGNRPVAAPRPAASAPAAPAANDDALLAELATFERDTTARELYVVARGHQTAYFRRADLPKTGRGDDADIPWETRRGDAAAPTWMFRGDKLRRRRGCDMALRLRPAPAGIFLCHWPCGWRPCVFFPGGEEGIDYAD